MDTLLPGLGFKRKIGYSLIGMFVGDLAMLVLFSLITQAWDKPPSYFLGTFPFYVTCSMFGWAVIGVPAMLFTNTEFVAKLNALWIVSGGILLGAAALLIIFIIYGRLPIAQFGGFLYCWAFAALVSCTASGVYVSLMRSAVRAQKESSISVDVPLPNPQQESFSLQDYVRQPEDETKPFDLK